MATITPAVSTHGLTKRFGRLVAVKGLDLAVEPGQTFGFLGLNGAGKTTTIRLLLDLLRPSAGRAAILGHDCQADGLAARALVGYMPAEPGFYRDMTGRHLLGVLARLSTRAVREAWRRELLDRLAFRDADLDRRIREYSSGMKRKLAIVSAFQADAPLLILDEPTEGLDPLMQEAFYALLADVREAGDDGVPVVARAVGSGPRVRPDCRPANGRTGARRACRAGEADGAAAGARRVQGARGGPAGRVAGDLIEVVDASPAQWSLRAHGSIGPVVESLAGLPVADLDVREPRLEDVVLHYYRGAP